MDCTRIVRTELWLISHWISPGALGRRLEPGAAIGARERAGYGGVGATSAPGGRVVLIVRHEERRRPETDTPCGRKKRAFVPTPSMALPSPHGEVVTTPATSIWRTRALRRPPRRRAVRRGHVLRVEARSFRPHGTAGPCAGEVVTTRGDVNLADEVIARVRHEERRHPERPTPYGW